MRNIAASLLIALAAAPAFSQQTLVETIEVRVANVDVVVQDKKGNPVVGLTKDDFILLDDKMPQTITNFYEIRRGDVNDPAEASAPAELRQRRVVLFIDAMSLTPSRRKQITESMTKFIETRMRPEDQAMIVVWRFGNHIVTPFTSDRLKLRQGLDSMSVFGPANVGNDAMMFKVRRDIDELVAAAAEENAAPTGDSRAVPNIPLVTWDQAYDQSRQIVHRFSEQLVIQQERLLDDATLIANGMAGLEGKKVFVFVGQHFQEHPGAELYRYVDNVYTGHVDALKSQLDLEQMMGVTGNSMSNLIERFADAASANGVTIYAIGAQGNDGLGGADETANPDFSYTFARDANTASALQHVASITGGVAITRTTNFDLAFDTISRDLSSYYSLGYKPLGEGARQHEIVVKTKNPAYRVRARQTFITKSTDDQMTDRTIGNLYADPGHNEWPISIRTGQPEKVAKGNFIVPIIVVIPSTVTLLPDQNDTVMGNVTLYLCVGNGTGATSTVLRRLEPIKIPKDRETLAREKPMLFKTAIRIGGGENTLSVGIIDQLSGTTGFARAKIVAQ